MIVLLSAICLGSIYCSFAYLPGRQLMPMPYRLISTTALASGNREHFDQNDDLGPVSFELTGITSDDKLECPLPSREIITDRNSIMFSGPSSHQVTLRWLQSPRRVLFLAKKDHDVLLPTIIEALSHLQSRNLKIFVEDHLHEQLINLSSSTSTTFLTEKSAAALSSVQSSLFSINSDLLESVDFIITFGGDGLLMHCNTLFGGKSVPPTMCFDFGSLGFLAPFRYENFETELDNLLSGISSLTLRMRLECSLFRNNKKIYTYHVLNEAVIDRGPSPFLSAIDLDCDNAYLTTVQGDGLIIATPTGSTAYSLAAGGSMVHPTVPAILITPICAHTLSFRPVLLPDSAILSCTVPSDARSSGWVSFDGKSRQELERGDRLSVKMSPYPLPTVNRLSFTNDWFESLRSQFMFNSRPRQKGF